MSETELRNELEQASAHLHPRTDAQTVWDLGTRARRRHRAMAVAGVAAAATAVVIGGAAVRSIDSTAPDPRPEATNPTPPDDSTVPARSIPYVTEDQVQPVLDPADLASVPWDEASGVRSWDPVDPVPLADDPVEHAGVAVQSDVDEPDAISVLGDDGRWRSLDVSGLEFPDGCWCYFGVTRGSLSPDGSRLALGQTEGVVVIDLTTSERTTFEVPGLGTHRQGREVFWSVDAATVYVQSTRSGSERAVDITTGDIHPVPFRPGASAFLADGRVVENAWSRAPGNPIRVYDADGELMLRARNSDEVDFLQYQAASGDRWAAQRIWSRWTSADPRGAHAPANGVLVMGPDVRPEAFLPVKNTLEDSGVPLEWRGDDTVVFGVIPPSAPRVALAWNVESGQITRIADYSSTGPVSVAADYLPTH